MKLCLLARNVSSVCSVNGYQFVQRLFQRTSKRPPLNLVHNDHSRDLMGTLGTSLGWPQPPDFHSSVGAMRSETMPKSRLCCHLPTISSIPMHLSATGGKYSPGQRQVCSSATETFNTSFWVFRYIRVATKRTGIGT